MERTIRRTMDRTMERTMRRVWTNNIKSHRYAYTRSYSNDNYDWFHSRQIITIDNVVVGMRL